jgi:hypothetical protein
MNLSTTDEKELLDLEQDLLDPATCASPDRLAGILAEGYVEYGASGRMYDREQAIAAVIASSIDPCTITGFSARWLDPDIALVNYRLIRRPSGAEPVHTRRHSIWKRVGEHWKILFHQGTPVAPAE